MSEVSVIVLTYNANWDKLRMTLNSVLLQKNVDFQIVLADDGSKTRWDEDIKNLFAKYEFENFVFANSKANGGTVKNLYNGLKYADGTYIKPISPGDFFYNDTALSGWVNYMKSNNSLFSFGDAVYYNNLSVSKSFLNPTGSGSSSALKKEFNECDQSAGSPESNDKSSISVNIVETAGAPQRRDLFKKPQDRKKIFESYLLANDTILGAAIMAETGLYKKYMERIVGRLVFAEDYLARLLVFDGIEIDYYEDYVIWYEYGTGASSSANEKWAGLLHKDFDESNHIIAESEAFFDNFSKKYCSFLRSSSESGLMHKIKKCAAFPGLIAYRAGDNKVPVSHEEIDMDFLALIFH